jgi:hypothetical protein
MGLSQSFVIGENHAFSVNLYRDNFYSRASYLTWSLGYATRIKNASLRLSGGYAPQAPGGYQFGKMTLSASFSVPFDIGNYHAHYYS